MPTPLYALIHTSPESAKGALFYGLLPRRDAVMTRGQLPAYDHALTIFPAYSGAYTQPRQRFGAPLVEVPRPCQLPQLPALRSQHQVPRTLLQHWSSTSRCIPYETARRRYAQPCVPSKMTTRVRLTGLPRLPFRASWIQLLEISDRSSSPACHHEEARRGINAGGAPSAASRLSCCCTSGELKSFSIGGHRSNLLCVLL